MPDSVIERAHSIPRWALERAEEEKCRFFDVVPNPENVDVWLRNPSGWIAYFALADYISRYEHPPIRIVEGDGQIKRLFVSGVEYIRKDGA